MKINFKYFSVFELSLWIISTLAIIISFSIFGGDGYLSLVASVIGAASLIFSAKGNPIGPFLMIIFSVLYGIISYSFEYWGELITYIGMSLPMSVIALIGWMKNPFEGKRSEVSVKRLSKLELILLVISTAIVTAIFFLILRALNTPSLTVSTVSVATSFCAVFLTFRRSPYFALAYAANDIVLIVLWVRASIADLGYVSVVTCFIVFLFNDLYGFFNWLHIARRQAAALRKAEAEENKI